MSQKRNKGEFHSPFYLTGIDNNHKAIVYYYRDSQLEVLENSEIIVSAEETESIVYNKYSKDSYDNICYAAEEHHRILNEI